MNQPPRHLFAKPPRKSVWQNVGKILEPKLDQRRMQGRLGLKPPLRLTFYKNIITCAREIDCFRILFTC